MSGFPDPSDAVLRQLLDQRAEIVLVDIDRRIRSEPSAPQMIHAAAGDAAISRWE
jgi:hypothetical protein